MNGAKLRLKSKDPKKEYENLHGEDKMDEDKQIKELKKALEELKDIAREEGYDIDKQIDKIMPEESLDEAQIKQVENRFGVNLSENDELRFSSMPGIVFTGEEAQRIREAMANPQVPVDEPFVTEKLSDEQVAEIAKKYFRVEMEQKEDD